MFKTALHDTHLKHSAKTVEFAGYSMPIQYVEGILKEHLWVREHAGLFDVSHMGQALLSGSGAADFINLITPSVFLNTPNFTAKYTVLTNPSGGIIDDLIITKISETEYFFVYNSGTKEKDEKWITLKLPAGLHFAPYRDRSLLALQGPKAEKILSVIIPAGLANQKYMTLQKVKSDKFGELFVSRLGYTGEDGFEISVADEHSNQLWDAIIDKGAKPIGLGARDSLRLEMGYPLYGHDINDETTPLEANLGWVIPKAVREKMQKPGKLRVGFHLDDKSIIREGVEVLGSDGTNNRVIGKVTSGGFSPTLQKPIAQGYVDFDYSAPGTPLIFELRGRQITGKVGPLSFIEPKTKSSK